MTGVQTCALPILKLANACFGDAHATLAFEVERLGDDADGQNAHLARDLRDHRRGSGAGAAAHAGGDEAHVGAHQVIADLLDGLFGGRAADFGLRESPFTDLVGGDLAANLAIVDAILAGRGPAGLVDTIVLNVATGLWITGRVPSIRDGLGLAREQLLGGAVRGKIAATKEFFATAA